MFMYNAKVTRLGDGSNNTLARSQITVFEK
jgi:hypothetical protein